jgi:hypothetical protein
MPAKTPEERLTLAQAQLDLAFDLINDLWTNDHLGLLITEPHHTKEDLEVREAIISTRLAILQASHQVQMLLSQED